MTTISSPDAGLTAQLRYLSEVLSELGGAVGATPADLDRCRAAEETLRRVQAERTEAQEQVALAKARLDAAEAMLAQTASAEAQTEAQTRTEVAELLNGLAAKPTVRHQYLRGLQEIFTPNAPVSEKAPAVAPAPPRPKNGFWSKLFTYEPVETPSTALFTLAAVPETTTEEPEPQRDPPASRTAFMLHEQTAH